MKKLLIMLMAVSMVAFLFVGCGVTPDPVDPVEPGETSTTPVITEIYCRDTDESDLDLYSSDIQYMNKEDISGGILIKGFAPKYSKVQVYIDGAVAGIGYSYGADEFIVFVSKANLGIDGEKSLGATATETGLAESGCSTVYKFTLDTVAPEIVNLIGEAEGFAIDDKVTLIVTFSEEIDEKSIDINSGHCLWDIRTGNYAPDELFTPTADPFDLVLPKVLEMEAKLRVGDISEFTLIRLAYDYTAPAPLIDPENLIFIADLAGNELLDYVDFCYLELVE
ncbi:hypothetical protein ES705_11128 [subsurface metagenome]